MKVGIVGLGFVGRAVAKSYAEPNQVMWYDPKVENSVGSLGYLLGCDGIFVCVPTPSNEDGSCDDSILRATLNKLASLGYNGIVIVKSTAPWTAIEESCLSLRVVFCPEFLRAATANEDYLAASYCVIGGSDSDVQAAKHVIKASSLVCKFVRTTLREAVLVKYFTNAFLATKVSMMNEFAMLAQSVGAPWETIRECLSEDQRIGQDHTQVPGPDGKRGWGGMCFPKDTRALLNLAREHGVNLSVVEAAVATNNKIRKPPCSTCNGEGEVRTGSWGARIKCPSCKNPAYVLDYVPDVK